MLCSGRGVRVLCGGVGSVAEGETEPSRWSGGMRCSGMRWPFPRSTRTCVRCDGSGCSVVCGGTCGWAAAVDSFRCTLSHLCKASCDRFTCPRLGGGRAGAIAGVGVASLAGSTDSEAALLDDVTHVFSAVPSI